MCLFVESRKYLILPLLWMVFTGDILSAQTQERPVVAADSLAKRVQLRGKVVGVDSSDVLPGAYIYLGSKKIAVTTTNEQGIFLLKDLPATEVVISVTYIGYQPFSQTYPLKSDTDIGVIRLHPEVLEEVVIVAKPPLAVQRGDTTQFNTAALRMVEDASLEDLLKKLPGFELVDGKIMAQGKEVTKLYIDGMEYSLNDPGAALKNLPAKLFAKIKMYDDRSEEAKFSGYNDGKKYRSLNLETHDPNRLKFFGRGSVGYGLTDPLANTFKENNYQGLVSASVFDPKRKVSLNGDFRNYGQNNELPGSSYHGGEGDNRTQTLFANLSSKWGEKVTFSGNYRFSNRDSYSASLSRQDYFPTDRYQRRIYDQESHSWNEGKSHSFNVHTQYDINDKNRISFSPTVNFSVNRTKSLNMGNNVENNDTVNISDTQGKDKRNNIQTSADFSWMHAFEKKGRTLTMLFNGSYSRNVSDQAQNNEESSLNSENVRIDTARNLLTTNHRTAYDWRASLTYSEPLTKYARLSFNYSYYQDRDFADKQSLSFRDKDFVELVGVDTSQTNQLTNQHSTHSYGVNYNFFNEKINLTGGLNINHTLMKNRYQYPGETDSLTRSVYTDVSPRAELSFVGYEHTNLSLTYQGSSSSPDALQLQDVLNVTDPLQVSKGNPGLKKSYNHSVYLNFSKSSSEKAVYWYSSLSAEQTLNQVSSNVTFIQRDTVVNNYTLLRGARLTVPVNLSGNWSMNVDGNCSFPWEKLKLRFTTSLSYSYGHSPSIYDGIKNLSTSHSASFRFNVNTNISEKLDLYLISGSSYSYSENSTTGGSQYFNERLNCGVHWSFWKNFFINSSFNGLYYINKKGESVNQSENVVNVKLGKKFGQKKQMELSLAANDILQERNSVNYSLNDLYAQTSYQTMQSTCYMLSFSYRFDNMKK